MARRRGRIPGFSRVLEQKNKNFCKIIDPVCFFGSFQNTKKNGKTWNSALSARHAAVWLIIDPFFFGEKFYFFYFFFGGGAFAQLCVQFRGLDRLVVLERWPVCLACSRWHGAEPSGGSDLWNADAHVHTSMSMLLLNTAARRCIELSHSTATRLAPLSFSLVNLPHA